MGSQTNRNISVIASTVCSPSPGAWQQEGAEPSAVSSEQCLGSKIVVLSEAEESFSGFTGFYMGSSAGTRLPMSQLKEKTFGRTTLIMPSHCPPALFSLNFMM